LVASSATMSASASHVTMSLSIAVSTMTQV
jgi:hypothetical protein